MKKIFVLNLIVSLWVSISFVQPAVATEPNMADYTAYPIFMVQAVKPNIMIILDNSSSMNFNAYGSWPGNGQEVTDALFAGEPYHQVTRTIEQSVSASEDDAEENTAAVGLFRKTRGEDGGFRRLGYAGAVRKRHPRRA